MIKYVIFDFDGTLVNSKTVLLTVYNKLANKYGFKLLNQDTVAYLQTFPLKERLRFLHVSLYKIPFILSDFFAEYRKLVDQVSLTEGMELVLQQLKEQGYSIAIISSNSAIIIKKVLKNHQIDFITAIFCSSKLFSKSKTIRMFIKKNKLKNTEIIYIGDEQRDIAACKMNNVPVIAVAWGFDGIQLITEENPTHIANTPEEILRIVRANY